MLFGRDDERARIGELLGAARAARSAALVVRGEPGIGKTALLEDTLERAGDMQVLSARGIESESDLPFAAVHQLLRPTLGNLGGLPQPQADALRGALGLGPGAGSERFLVYTACLTLLSDLAERRPVLCVVDDAQWLDTASSECLQFVARRLGAEGILLLFGAREGDVRRFEAQGVPSLTLAGLAPEAAAALLEHAAGDAAPAVRARLVEQTHGNALALVELPSALSRAQLSGAEPLPDELPMTSHLEAVFGGRVARLPDASRRLLLVAATDGSEDLGLITRAGAQLGCDPYALDAAERSGLVSVRGSRITFRHPLVRSAVHGAATSGERRAAHRALADALRDDAAEADRRAWHLAASALEGDEGVVHELDQAARRAEGRGGHVAAAAARQRGAQLALDPATRGALLIGAARSLSLAGRDEQAMALAARATGLVIDPKDRAELVRVRAIGAVRSGGELPEVVQETLAAAREVGPGDPAMATDLLTRAAMATWLSGELGPMAEIAEVANGLAPKSLDGDSRMIARSLAGFAAIVGGRTTEGAELLRATAEWGAEVDDAYHVLWAAGTAVWLGRDDTFEGLLSRAAHLSRARGEIGTLCEVLGRRSIHLSLMAQRYDDAAVTAGEAVELSRELSAENISLFPRAVLGIVAAIKGRDDDARRAAEEVLDSAYAKRLRRWGSPAVAALVTLDIGRGRWDEALERLTSLLADPIDPVVAMTAPDRIEAAVRAGRREQAQEALTFLEARAAISGTRAVRPRLASCRALLAEGEEAAAHFAEAIRLIGDARPFDRPRIHLLHGEYLRREGQRVAAREQLRAAIEGFDAIGAEPWAERARRELSASGETARKRTPEASAQLTPQERQIARLVARGLTNKEVAAELFLSPRTIDAHLRGVFSKLGITSRRELRGVDLGGAERAA